MTSGFLGLASILDAQYGCGGRSPTYNRSLFLKHSRLPSPAPARLGILLVSVKHFVKTIINRFHSFTWNIVAMRAGWTYNRSLFLKHSRLPTPAPARLGILLVSVKHFAKTIINRFHSFAWNMVASAPRHSGGVPPVLISNDTFVCLLPKT